MSTRRCLIGFGNYSRGDDGIGLRLVEAIAERGLDTDFEAVEVGNDGMKLLTYFAADVGRILVVDCARMGMAPGEARIFSPDEAESVKVVEGLSTHEGDVLAVIELGRRLGLPAPEIRLLGIEPASLAMEMELSPLLAARFEALLAMAVAEIRRPA